MDKEQIIVSWALAQRGAPYVYGGTGQRCTPAYRRERIAQYPQYKAPIQAACPVLSGTKVSCAGCRHEGRPCYDCAQFTRRALEQAGMSIPSGASSQWRSNSWAEKGPVAAMPRGQLCVLFRESGDLAYPMAHTGLYLGDGNAMDARGHMQGVLHMPVTSYPWTHYAIPRGLDGLATTLAEGAKGDHVTRLQQLLMACGYDLPRHGADGSFGPETLSALHRFQRDNGMAETPEADDAVLGLLEDMADKAAPDAMASLAKRVLALEKRLAKCGACAQGVTA